VRQAPLVDDIGEIGHLVLVQGGQRPRPVIRPYRVREEPSSRLRRMIGR